MKKWECSVCGYVHTGEEAPEKCPKCGAPKEKFVELAADKVELIEKSARTNSLEMELFGVMETVVDIAEEGIDLNLDPGCVNLFKKAKAEALVMMEIIKAELKTDRKSVV